MNLPSFPRQALRKHHKEAPLASHASSKSSRLKLSIGNQVWVSGYRSYQLSRRICPPLYQWLNATTHTCQTGRVRRPASRNPPSHGRAETSDRGERDRLNWVRNREAPDIFTGHLYFGRASLSHSKVGASCMVFLALRMCRLVGLPDVRVESCSPDELSDLIASSNFSTIDSMSSTCSAEIPLPSPQSGRAIIIRRHPPPSGYHHPHDSSQ